MMNDDINMMPTIFQRYVSMDEKYGEYDFESRKRRRQNLYLDREVAAANLRQINDFLSKKGVKLVLLYGTLLGAVRDGNFITHDTDTDIGILPEQRDLFVSLIPGILNLGFQLIRTKHPDDIVTFMRHDEYIDFALFGIHNDRFYSYQSNKIDRVFLDELMRFDFNGGSFFVPCQYERYLVLCYGRNWKTPRINEPAIEMGNDNRYLRIRRVVGRSFLGHILKVLRKLMKGSHV